MLFVGIPSTLFLTGIIAWIGHRDFQTAKQQTRLQAIHLATTEARQLDSTLNSASHIAKTHAALLETNILSSPEQIKKHLLHTLTHYRDLIYGTCIAFEPEQLIPNTTHYAPYAFWQNNTPQYRNLIPPEYNHFQTEWYNLPKKTGKPHWTEPYYDQGGGNVLMTTHAYPIYHNTPNKTFKGVATIDIQLPTLVNNLANIQVAHTGYAILISPQGRILSHPDPSQIYHTNIKHHFPQLHTHLQNKKQGFIRLPNPWRQQQDSWIAYSTIQNSGFTLALIYPRHEIIQPAILSLIEFTLVSLLGIIGLFIALTFISHSITKPISNLSTATAKIANGDLNHPLDHNISFREGRHLAQAFEKMSRDLRTRMSELQENSATKARLTGELNAARRIQTSMLPGKWSTNSSWSHHPDISLDAIMQPAREIGGDFYDHRFLDENHLAILIGDVSGKGVPAALFMAMTQTLFKAYSTPNITPAKIIQNVNHALCNETHTGMFVTTAYAILNTRTSQLQLCNAGHAPPLLLNHNGQTQPLQSQRHPALGLIRNHPFTTTTFQLQPNDKIIFYTDGVTEALNQNRELYGLQRLTQLLQQNHHLPVHKLTQLITHSIHQYTNQQENTDDITILAIKTNPRTPIPNPTET